MQSTLVNPRSNEVVTSRLTFTVEEAALALGIGRGLAYEMVREGSLPCLRLGQRRIVIPRAGLEAMLAGPENAQQQ